MREKNSLAFGYYLDLRSGMQGKKAADRFFTREQRSGPRQCQIPESGLEFDTTFFLRGCREKKIGDCVEEQAFLKCAAYWLE